MPKNNLHVSPKKKKWQIRRSRAIRASRVFTTKDEAIEYAYDVARFEKLVVFIYNNIGRIEERVDFSIRFKR